jgi:AICAR transformylase/IMP cyclohydrolase PurH
MNMSELELKYGCNPNQKPAKIFMKNGGTLPIEILNGKPGYINLLDAFNSWQLVKELKEATGLPSAASFKHVSPAGAAVGYPLDETLRKMYYAASDISPVASAYIRARGADRVASYGDFAALSDECDADTAAYLKSEVSDGIIAPSYTDEALQILKSKRKGGYTIIKVDAGYVPEVQETKDVFGVTFEQGRNNITFTKDMFKDFNVPTVNKEFTDGAVIDLLIAQITLKYTQSNSVCYVADGQAIGIGAGQQARIHCTRLAGNKADAWFLRKHPKVQNLPFKDGIKHPDKDNAIDVYISDFDEDILSDGLWENAFSYKPEPLTKEEKTDWLKGMKNIALGSDAFFPFGDNIDRANKSGVKYIIQPGGSIRDDNVIETCDKYGIAMAFTGTRLFHH